MYYPVSAWRLYDLLALRLRQQPYISSADGIILSIDALQCMYKPPDKGNGAGTVNQNFFVIFQIKVQKPQVQDIFSYK